MRSNGAPLYWGFVNLRLGCSIVLRGSDSMEELTAAKRVLLFAAYASYMLRLEGFLLDNQFVRRPHPPIFRRLKPHFLFYEGVSVTRRVTPYTYRKIL